MEKENIERVFDDLKGSFDIEEPRHGHEARFLQKLIASKEDKNLRARKNGLRKMLLIAASIAFLCAISVGLYESQPTLEERVAKISPEVSKTEFYFANLIEEQVQELENGSTPETRQIIDDTMVQLKSLEKSYARLEQDLLNGGNSQLILSAMIKNFQTRMDLLQEVLEKMEIIKNLKNYDNAKSTI